MKLSVLFMVVMSEKLYEIAREEYKINRQLHVDPQDGQKAEKQKR